MCNHHDDNDHNDYYHHDHHNYHHDHHDNAASGPGLAGPGPRSASLTT
jgi:hypothetical protein